MSIMMVKMGCFSQSKTTCIYIYHQYIISIVERKVLHKSFKHGKCVQLSDLLLRKNIVGGCWWSKNSWLFQFAAGFPAGSTSANKIITTSKKHLQYSGHISEYFRHFQTLLATLRSCPSYPWSMLWSWWGRSNLCGNPWEILLAAVS